VTHRRQVAPLASSSTRELPTYVCQADMIEKGGVTCQAIPGAGIDTAVGHSGKWSYQ